MRLLTYSVLVLFSLPMLILCTYLSIGIYEGANILHSFMQDSFLVALKQSIILSSFSTVLALMAGLLFAKAFCTLKHTVLQTLYLLVLVVLFMIQPIMILSVAKQVKLFGTLNPLSQSITIATLHLLPIATLFWISIYRYIQTEALSIAHYLSTTKWSTYRYIIFPQIRLRIGLAFLFLFVLVFIDQEVPSILGYRTYTEELLSQMTLMEEMQTIVLSALPSFMLVGLLSLGIIFGFNKNAVSFSNTISLNIQSDTPFGKITLAALYLWLGAMLFILLKTSLAVSIKILFNNNIEVILQTLSVAVAVSLCTLVLSILVQHMLKQYASRTVHVIWACVLLCYLLLPHSLISLSLLNIYQKIGIFSSVGDFVIFFLGYVFVLLPIAFLLLFLFAMQEKKDYFLDFFPVPIYQRWLKITLPKQWAVWTIIFLILMTFTLNELSVSILLVPPGFETMIVKIYNLLHYGDKANIAFLSLVQILFLIGCFAILSFLSKKAIR